MAWDKSISPACSTGSGALAGSGGTGAAARPCGRCGKAGGAVGPGSAAGRAGVPEAGNAAGAAGAAGVVACATATGVAVGTTTTGFVVAVTMTGLVETSTTIGALVAVEVATGAPFVGEAGELRRLRWGFSSGAGGAVFELAETLVGAEFELAGAVVAAFVAAAALVSVTPSAWCRARSNIASRLAVSVSLLAGGDWAHAAQHMSNKVRVMVFTVVWRLREPGCCSWHFYG